METLYSIGEAADLLGVSVPTLRLYEREGLIIPIRKKSRHRLYAPSDLERIRCLRKSINQDKVGIAGMRRMLALIPCWKVHECKAPDRETCPAFSDDQTPCWKVSPRPVACSDADCRNCTVYNHVTDCTALKRTIAQFTIDKG
ncbi:MAG: MerR family transcriptional regulator [Ignavibacteriae bacterium]|nr:MerR family transcriptional regulator [Ignavibacteriota bacterium]